jgi:hypothetical protein
MLLMLQREHLVQRAQTVAPRSPGGSAPRRARGRGGGDGGLEGSRREGNRVGTELRRRRMLRGKRERERGGLAEFLYERDCDGTVQKRGSSQFRQIFLFPIAMPATFFFQSFGLLRICYPWKKPNRFPCFSKKLFVGFTVRKYTPLVEHVIQLLHGVVFELYILPRFVIDVVPTN